MHSENSMRSEISIIQIWWVRDMLRRINCWSPMAVDRSMRIKYLWRRRVIVQCSWHHCFVVQTAWKTYTQLPSLFIFSNTSCGLVMPHGDKDLGPRDYCHIKSVLWHSRGDGDVLMILIWNKCLKIAFLLQLSQGPINQSPKNRE